MADRATQLVFLLHPALCIIQIDHLPITVVAVKFSVNFNDLPHLHVDRYCRSHTSGECTFVFCADTQSYTDDDKSWDNSLFKLERVSNRYD